MSANAKLFDIDWPHVETKYRKFLQDANDMLLVAKEIEVPTYTLPIPLTGILAPIPNPKPYPYPYP